MAKHRPLRRLIRSLWYACLRWAKCDCVDLSAAFAYYTLQSIFPILLISLSIASWFLGRQEVLERQIIAYASGVLPPSAVVIVQNTLMQLVRQGFGAGLLGAGVLLLTAGNVYLTLQRGSERLWDGVIASQQRNLPFKLQAAQFIRNRLEAFFVVILIGLLIVLDQLSANVRMIPTAALTELSLAIPWLGGFLSRIPVLQFGRLMVPFLGFSAAALLLQFLLPSRRVPFKPLIPGALLIGFCLTVLNLAVSRSILSLGARFQAYGVIGSVLVLTLWVWMVGVVIYFGQCWSVELAKASVRHGRDPNRSSHA
ncbi:YihY/virulence factor BrkB family protein [Synechococcus sp. UW179B]|jgi:membrane protein|uniref:YihY/virulence factor BrkB family protein n=1 Tax=Synechococcus sp. UW179B TaxID=2575516 RepID=UPI000E0E877B|nr:YihY/virulence factor BrkB family protein [Synechococcus sp. UW179B]